VSGLILPLPPMGRCQQRGQDTAHAHRRASVGRGGSCPGSGGGPQHPLPFRQQRAHTLGAWVAEQTAPTVGSLRLERALPPRAQVLAGQAALLDPGSALSAPAAQGLVPRRRVTRHKPGEAPASRPSAGSCLRTHAPTPRAHGAFLPVSKGQDLGGKKGAEEGEHHPAWAANIFLRLVHHRL